MQLLIDIHCHLDDKRFTDLDEVIERAKKQGLKLIITNGISHETNLKSLDIAKKYDIVKPALGLYPSLANKTDIDLELEFIKKNKNKIAAIGEIGLDGTVDVPIEEQKKVFIKLLSLGNELDKPVIIHTRKAEKETINVLESSNIKNVILHCFSGNFKLIKKAEQLGYYFSIPANIVFNEHFQKMAKEIDISRIFTETDAPYLGPFKGKRNEPANIIESIKKIAKIKNMDATEVANNIWMNYQKVFM